MTYSFRFDVHHIFPRELFDYPMDQTSDNSPTIGDVLTALFSGQDIGISEDMSANSIGLFWTPGLVPNLSSLIEAGFGASPHGSIGGHQSYNDFLIGQVHGVLSHTGLSAEQKADALIETHFFATTVSQGGMVDGNGSPIHVGSSMVDFESAWDQFNEALSDPQDPIHNDFASYETNILAAGQNETDAGLSTNYEHAATLPPQRRKSVGSPVYRLLWLVRTTALRVATTDQADYARFQRSETMPFNFVVVVSKRC
ncbi:MAG: hypothetical protein HWE35_08365, partial [Rhodobacteraceae bacterium]|nr:hypothetical protein [Paracoccaceae bacterium]